MTTNENIQRVGPSGDLAVIGEGTPNQSSVSIQVLQNIYHELTGKSEEVSKSYSEPFRVGLTDFEQLDHRINQCCEQYCVHTDNCHVKVFYIDDTQETFSSFEKFRQFSAGRASVVESVLLTYNFLVVLPKLQKPQSYTLSIRVASPIAVSKSLRDGMPFKIPKIFRAIGSRTAVVTVKYVDYVVARTLINTVDSWFGTVDRAPRASVWRWIVSHSHLLPMIARYCAFCVVGATLFMVLPSLVPLTATLQQLGSFMLGSAAAIFASYQLAHHIGSAAEASVDQWTALAYISLTAGDRRLIQEAETANRRNAVSAVLKWTLSLLVSLVAKIVVGYWTRLG